MLGLSRRSEPKWCPDVLYCVKRDWGCIHGLSHCRPSLHETPGTPNAALSFLLATQSLDSNIFSPLFSPNPSLLDTVVPRWTPQRHVGPTLSCALFYAYAVTLLGLFAAVASPHKPSSASNPSTTNNGLLSPAQHDHTMRPSEPPAQTIRPIPSHVSAGPVGGLQRSEGDEEPIAPTRLTSGDVLHCRLATAWDGYVPQRVLALSMPPWRTAGACLSSATPIGAAGTG